jgi:hypothetical protein
VHSTSCWPFILAASSSKVTARPVAPAAVRVQVTRTSISLPEDSVAMYTLVIAACRARSSVPEAAVATPTELSPKQDSSLMTMGGGRSNAWRARGEEAGVLIRWLSLQGRWQWQAAEGMID